MSNSIPNQVEAGSTGSTMADPLSAANANPETVADALAMRPTPLAEALKHAHPQPLRQYRGAESVSSFSNPADELAALLSNAGVFDLGWRQLIRCTGEDRVRWLNGMVTNFVGNLEENAGCYAFVLNAQGRIQGDLDIYRRADSVWLETDASQIEALSAFLDHYIIMDDVDARVAAAMDCAWDCRAARRHNLSRSRPAGSRFAMAHVRNNLARAFRDCHCSP